MDVTQVFNATVKLHDLSVVGGFVEVPSSNRKVMKLPTASGETEDIRLSQNGGCIWIAGETTRFDMIGGQISNLSLIHI